VKPALLHPSQAPGIGGLKVFLSKWLDEGPVCVAQAADGSLHLVFEGRSIGSDATLNGLFQKARERLPSGTDAGSGWYLSAEPLSGPVNR
jgi:hypothetical protein